MALVAAAALGGVTVTGRTPCGSGKTRTGPSGGARTAKWRTPGPVWPASDAPAAADPRLLALLPSLARKTTHACTHVNTRRRRRQPPSPPAAAEQHGQQLASEKSSRSKACGGRWRRQPSP
jgi:hypothetical protein